MASCATIGTEAPLRSIAQQDPARPRFHEDDAVKGSAWTGYLPRNASLTLTSLSPTNQSVCVLIVGV